MAQQKQRVAILGGGLGSLVAAYGLTSTEALRQRYEVTVHQLGWRLGGKGASGRDAEVAQRIQEHGLHIWFGFYDNAFQVMKECYAALERPDGAPLATFDTAFLPADDVVLFEHYGDRWKGWDFHLPRTPFEPGVPGPLPSFWDIMHAALTWLSDRWSALRSTHPALQQVPPDPQPPAAVPGAIGALAGLVLGAPQRLLADALTLATRRLEGAAGQFLEDRIREAVGAGLAGFRDWLWREIAEPNLDDDDLRLFFTMVDLVSTVILGILADGLIEHGFDSINDQELRAWLTRHGAQGITVQDNPVLRGAYAVAFAYLDGDSARPVLAAGAAVRGLLRLAFTYRGAFMWKMAAGMGDTVFTPLYQVLLDRGVHFEFFHCVTRLGLTAGGRRVDTIGILPQVTLADPEAGYQPLVSVLGLDCWPSQPLWDQVVDGPALSGLDLEAGDAAPGAQAFELQRGRDFDLVVLGIAVGALEPICQELVDNPADSRFRDMIANSPTVMTQAFQLWLDRSPQQLGWQFADNSASTAFVDPINTYANMSQLLPREEWPAGAGVQSIAYFCGVLQDRDGDTQVEATQRAHDTAIAYLQGAVTTLWPACSAPGSPGLDWSRLIDLHGGAGQSRFEAQFVRANFQPTERYVLTPPGNPGKRLRADQSGYDNLYLAGDWIKTGLDAGCVEAAVMSGLQASRAICGEPQQVWGENDDWL